MYLAVKNQIINRHSLPLSIKKMSSRIFFKDFTDKRKISCLNPFSGHYATAKRGTFLSQEEVDGIDRIKTPYNRVKIEISTSRSIFQSFHTFLWSMDHTQKMKFQ